jgi:hypothetical protein
MKIPNERSEVYINPVEEDGKVIGFRFDDSKTIRQYGCSIVDVRLSQVTKETFGRALMLLFHSLEEKGFVELEKDERVRLELSLIRVDK